MFCDEVIDALEPIAAGELAPDGRIAAHLASCPNCATALDAARQVEALLHARPAPAAPSQFTSRTMARLRRQRWQSEQFLDAGFNAALALIALGIVGVVWVVLNRTGLVPAGGGTLGTLGSGVSELARRLGPSVPLYAGATALLVAALGIWWWAERDTAL